jgi:hypothetical protein
MTLNPRLIQLADARVMKKVRKSATLRGVDKKGRKIANFCRRLCGLENNP